MLEQLFVGEVNHLLFPWTNLQLKRYSLIHLSVSCCLPCIYINMVEYSVFQTPTHDVVVVVKSLQPCPTLCDPIDGSPPGSPVPGILQARTLEWAAISFSNAWKWKAKVKSLSKCPTLRDRMDCSLPGSSIHGIFQARVLEWGAIAFSANSWYKWIMK